jgi:hypothetical protein
MALSDELVFGFVGVGGYSDQLAREENSQLLVSASVGGNSQYVRSAWAEIQLAWAEIQLAWAEIQQAWAEIQLAWADFQLRGISTRVGGKSNSLPGRKINQPGRKLFLSSRCYLNNKIILLFTTVNWQRKTSKI